MLFSLFFFLHSSLPAKSASPPIVIGEVAWAGSSLSTADEWIELWNLGDDGQSLNGWRLKGASGDHDIVFGSDAIIPPQNVFLISNYSSDDAKSVLNAVSDIVTTTISLPNDKLLIQLADAAGTIIDQAGSGTIPPAGTSGSAKASMIRFLSIDDGSVATSWTTASEAQNLDPGATDRGTPGYCDGCMTMAAADAAPEKPVTDSPTESVADAPAQPELPPAEPPAPADSPAEDAPITAAETSDANATLNNAPDADIATFAGASSTASTETPTAETLETSAAETASASTSTEESMAADSFATTTTVTVTTTTSITTATSSDPIPPIQEAAAALPATPAAASPQTVQQTTVVLPTIRINEIFPAPSNGSEWVELASDDAFQPSQLDGWTLEDATGVIYRFDHTKNGFAETPMHYLIVTLASSHLNNSGDEVHLKTASGQLVHQVSYASTIKDQSWIRMPNETVVWRLTTTPTPNAPNLLTIVTPNAPTPIIAQIEAPIAAIVETAEEPSSDPPATAPVAAAATTSTAVEPPRATIALAANRPKIASPAIASSTTTRAMAVKPKPKPKTTKAAVKKSAAPKTAAIIQSSSIPMLFHAASGLRASLTGVVATVPKLLGNNQFVLQTEDGRGLLIYGNGKQPSPAYQSSVRVSGTLVTNDSGTSLHMYAQDRWTLLQEQAVVAPRVVDLLVPSWEDAWSFVAVTATVRDVKTTFATLDAGDASIKLQIRPAVPFRTERLRPGDVIRVEGLLDTRTEDLKIIPRKPEEIMIVKHAALAKAEAGTSPEKSLPPWTPIGAAGATIALAQGAKRLQKIREQRRLTALLKQASNEMIQTNV